tara:strand:- start:2169 stop:2690 length:522 start_codon:yes stop_codon:yes gene_type:complete
MRAFFLRFFTWITGINLTEIKDSIADIPDPVCLEEVLAHDIPALSESLDAVIGSVEAMSNWENYCPDDFDSRIAELESLDHSAKFEEIEATTESQMESVAEMLEMVHNQAVTTSTVDSQISEHLHGYCTEEDLEDLNIKVTNLDNTNGELIEKLYEASKCLSRAANLMALGSG